MTLICIGGLPGSGKSTLAAKLGAVIGVWGAVRHVHWEADQFMVDANGYYTYDRNRLKECHEKCQQSVKESLRNGTHVVTVANTFTQRWEIDIYAKMAKEFGYEFQFIRLYTPHSDEELAARNVHDCPAETIHKMRQRVEHWP